MAGMTTTVARLACDEPTARLLASTLGESLDGAVCAAFETTAGDGRWRSISARRPMKPRCGRWLNSRRARTAAQALTLETVEATDWVAASLAGLQPVAAGRFIVHGAHDRARIAPNRIGIEIEAALAFGTGHHGTTRGCLWRSMRWRRKVAARKASLRHPEARAKRASKGGGRSSFEGRLRRPPQDDGHGLASTDTRVLDLGTGSGVLAIAAAKALRAKVTASDSDPRAVAVAHVNARLNAPAT